MPIAVKRHHSGMTGAPTLSGTVGALVSLLDACLVNGFNAKTVTLAQSAGTATATCSGHGFQPNDVIVVSGANEAAWNDEFRVLTAATNSFTFAIAAGTTSPATGTITAKIAPLGWTKPFSGTNKAAYLPKAQYVQCYLRVLDDATVPTSASGRWAKARGYDTMTDVDTGTGLFPTVAQATNALSICKSGVSDSTARPWWLAGDGGIFYLGVAHNATYPTAFAAYCFGDIASLRAGDCYSSLLIASSEGIDTLIASPGGSNYFSYLGNYGITQSGKFIARSYTQIGSAVAVGMIGDNGISTSIGGAGLAYPHPPDNGLLFAPIAVTETSCVRSRALPGIYQPLHATPLSHLDIVTGVPDLSGRTMQAFNLAASGGTSPLQCLIDITGPWR